MEIVYKLISDLAPYENNPRNNARAIDKVAASIKEFGFKVPIVVDTNNIIVCGHTRLEAAKQLGLNEVPCIIADDLTEEQIKAFRLADNKVAEFSSWDFIELENELKDLTINMSDFGFADKPEIENSESNNSNDEEEQQGEDEEQGEDEGEVKKADVNVRVGEYNFILKRDEYMGLIEDINFTVGFVKDDINKELRRRLLCN